MRKSCLFCTSWNTHPLIGDAVFGELGFCHKKPPATEGFPVTHMADWCQEFTVDVLAFQFYYECQQSLLA